MNQFKTLSFVLWRRIFKGISFRPPELHSSAGEMTEEIEIPKILFIYFFLYIYFQSDNNIKP